MQMSDARVTARLVRTEGGENYTEYRVGGVSYPLDRGGQRGA
jgi:hypothetical protein